MAKKKAVASVLKGTFDFFDDVRQLVDSVGPEEAKSCEEYVFNGGKREDHTYTLIKRIEKKLDEIDKLKKEMKGVLNG